MSFTIHAGKAVKSLFVTNENAAARRQTEKEDNNRRSTVFAGNIGVRPDSITIKKKQAQKQAMKVLMDTFDSEKKMDQSMDDVSAQMQELKDANVGYHKELEQIRGEKQELMERYGVTEDSTEYPEEYQQQLQELEEKENLYSGYIKRNDASIIGISRSLGDMSIERLKSNPMVKAEKESEEILEAANKAIYGELVNEAKKHIEEKMEEAKEKAEKLAEKKEEEEERLEKKEEKEEKLEDAQNKETIETLNSYNDPDPQIKKEIDEILDELKLIQEDLKGVKVDSNI